MKLWEKVVEARLKEKLFCELLYDFMPRKKLQMLGFSLRMLTEKYRKGQKELPCAFVNLKKTYGSVLREELSFYIRMSMRDYMHEISMTVVRWVGVMDGF